MAGMLQCHLLHSVLREKICIVFTRRVDTSREFAPHLKTTLFKTLYADRAALLFRDPDYKKKNKWIHEDIDRIPKTKYVYDSARHKRLHEFGRRQGRKVDAFVPILLRWATCLRYSKDNID